MKSSKLCTVFVCVGMFAYSTRRVGRAFESGFSKARTARGVTTGKSYHTVIAGLSWVLLDTSQRHPGAACQSVIRTKGVPPARTFASF